MKLIGILIAALAATSIGCSVHSQSPVKEVAYDFSDHASYDRPFGQSPTVGEVDEEDADEQAGKVARGGAADPTMVAFPCNKPLDGEDEEITCYFHHRKGKGASTAEVQMINGEAQGNTAPLAPQAAPAAPPPVTAPPAQPPVAGPAR